jgi:predicted metal-binding membrane protein
MPGMEMPSAAMASPSDAAAYLASAFVMWFLMMIAMMLPSATQMIMLYGGLARGARAGQAVLAPTSIFAGAYLAVWGGFSALAALAQWLLVRSGAVSEINLAFGNQRVCGALLIAAGLYQATPLKRACLQNCRPPMSFLMRFWQHAWVSPTGPIVSAAAHC